MVPCVIVCTGVVDPKIWPNLDLKIIVEKNIIYFLDYKKIMAPEEMFSHLSVESLNGEFMSSI